MCGIVGYTGDFKSASKLVLDGLELLEYRGYDSAGVAILNSTGLEVRRRMGKLRHIRSELEADLGENHLAIGHTRWATHGRPSEENAHPHADNAGRLVVVHNGIIENYLQLKDWLKSEGHIFTSDTDTEIIAHLIAHYENGDLFQAFLKALGDLEGAYALAVSHVDYPDQIFVACKHCPLIVGHMDEGVGSFVASDVLAMLRYCSQVVYLKDEQAGILSPSELKLFKIPGGEPLDFSLDRIEWNPVMAEKGGYRHFMLKEIHEQPDVIRNTIGSRADEEKGLVYLDEVNLSEEAISQCKRIQIVACGTAFYAGLVGKYLLEKLTRIPVHVELASEFRYREPICDEGSLVIAVSQSGETADTIAAADLAMRQGARTVGVINVRGSTLSRKVDGNLYICAGPEIGVASTKAYMAMLVAFELLALFIGGKKGVLAQDRLKSLIHKLRMIPQKLEVVLQSRDKIEALAHQFQDYKNFLYLGRDLNYPTALEGALKLKEISYIHAEGYAAGEMKHGPIALLDKDCPVVAIMTQDSVYSKVLSNVVEASSRDSRILAIASEGDEDVEKIVNDVFYVPRVDPLLSPLVNVVPLQLLAYYIADLKGADVDQPRNLAKSVTVE
jgi:glutamine---fructose-6-phosphate transaminase (isomerizing)